MLGVFADACYLIGLQHKDDDNHKAAKALAKELASQKIGTKNFVVTDYILIEVFHRLQDKVGYSDALKFHQQLLKESTLHLVDRAILDEAVKSKLTPFVDEATARPPIGIADATSL